MKIIIIVGILMKIIIVMGMLNFNCPNIYYIQWDYQFSIFNRVHLIKNT